jgi:bifunctional UDP-N-acetylglucosamine pyrophosphorylase / glucosamine-1-phosphate N-acetyltransferase
MPINQDIAAIILAAGKGTRIKASDQKNKVVFPLGRKPMIVRSVEKVIQSGITQIYVVVGFAADSVKQALGDQVKYAHQTVPKGTADAVKAALPKVSPTIKHLLVMYGDDSAFYPPAMLKAFVESHLNSGCKVSLLTLTVDNPQGLGRIIRNQAGDISSIVEEKNATDQEKQIREINTGLYCFESAFIQDSINKIDKNPLTGEYYLTDIIAIAKAANYPINGFKWPDSDVWFGINTQEQLKEAQTKIAKG